MLKATNFLCFWNSWVVATRVVAVGRSALLLLLLVLLEGALHFLQPTKAGTNKVGTLESRCQNFSLSPILFFFSSCWVKKKQKRCSAALAGVVVLSDIATTLRGPARCRTLQQHAARSSVLSAIAATLRRPARCCSNAGRTLQAAVRCRPMPQQRCELQRSRPSLQRYEELQCSTAARHRRSGGWALHVRLSSDVCLTFVPRISSRRSACVIADVIVLRPAYVPADVIVLASCVLHT